MILKKKTDIRYFFLLIPVCVACLTARADDFLLQAPLHQSFSVNSEELLLTALEYIHNDDVEAALEELQQLIRINPDFKIAQLMYADMMLAKSQRIVDFGNIPKASFERISALREELQARWNYHQTPVDYDKIPAALIQLASEQGNVIVVDSSRSRLFLFKNQGSTPFLIKDFYVTIGKKGVGKYVEGDQKTPVGLYFITSFIDPKVLPDLYGDGAFPINYPNAWDQRHGRTGHGIWLHGTPGNMYSRPPRDSNGCVIVSNDDLNILSRFIHTGKTPVIISEKIDWITKQQWRERQTSYKLLVEQWRKDWESKDVSLYLRHYSKDYPSLGKDYQSWVEYEKKINSSKKHITANISDTSIFFYPGEEQQLMVVTFVQDHKNDSAKRKFTKRQYWRMEGDGVWRIVYEDTVS